ncbi:hypothetical protein RND81_03G218500 [Saponaria officinalis]|uniref:Uncharacterized protein n=1 Tax=Saponaria officinalis TaxID=3572 RepID=A0AAW1M9D1_SAPOF
MPVLLLLIAESKNFALHSDMSSEFQRLLGPSLDHLDCNPSLPSFVGSPTCKVECLPKEGKSRYSHERRNCHSSEDSLENKKVTQTTDTNSSPHKIKLSCHSPNPNLRSPNFDLSDLSRDQISRLWFECELDSVTELLRDSQILELDSSRASFEFNPLIKLDNSVDLPLFRESMDTGMPDISESLLHRLPAPEARILWREGLASRMFEMDELDSCRYLSDDEDNVNDNRDTSESCPCLQLGATFSDKIIEDAYHTTRSLQPEDGISRKHSISPLLEGDTPCLKSTDVDGRYELVPEDSSWTVCYRNNLFQV